MAPPVSFTNIIDDAVGTTTATMSGSTLFERCAVEYDGDQPLMLQCVANGLEQQSKSNSSDIDEWLLVFAGGLVFFMQVRVVKLPWACFFV